MAFDPQFYKNRNVFVTGHTGFKGAWLCKILTRLGAKVTGYSLQPPTTPSLFEISGISAGLNSVIGDIRNFAKLQEVLSVTEPEIVFHLAAQPIVRKGYEDPSFTYETNVMGTVNLLECVRQSTSVKSFINVTTDKVYQNNEWEWGYRESDQLDGFDPYSNSKSCSELVTRTYRRSFFQNSSTSISTCRAGNVIGGGDFAIDRIIPDCVRAVSSGKPILVRNPNSIRPYQHVLEPLFAYLIIAEKQYLAPSFSGSFNIGPDLGDNINTGELVNLFCETWGNGAIWEVTGQEGPHEATYLKLDCSLIRAVFNWSPKWHITDAIMKTCEWTRAWLENENINQVMDNQIQEYLECLN